jgi:hypothetical protein
MLKYDHFTKTGSGHTERKLQNQRPVFVQNLLWLNGHNHYHHNGLSNIRRFHTDVRNGDDSSPGTGSEEVKTAAAAAAPGGCGGGFAGWVGYADAASALTRRTLLSLPPVRCGLVEVVAAAFG